MDNKVLKWGYDIKFSIDEIEGYFDKTDRDFFQYCQNPMMKRAVERNLEIIGEAMNRILTRDAVLGEKITSSRAIVQLRNQIIHAYDSISDENIWSILTTHLPILQSEIESLIVEINES